LVKTAAELGRQDRSGLSIGALAEVGIKYAARDGAQKESLERWLSKISLAQSGYGHFTSSTTVVTTSGWRHRKTRRRARFGETFWSFLPRSVFGKPALRRCGWRPADTPAGGASVEPENLPV